jgi:class 3 adenylate cyclase/tetratricopeptide (TPR) repeat protein
VQTAADADRLSRLAAAAPAPLADKIRAAHLTGERKIVTCLFADVVGSTSLAERLDPDDWTEIMNRAFDRLSPAIYDYEGTIARLMGDAILAFFGAPVTHEDDPVRAVRAALEMLTRAHRYADEVRRLHGIEFAIRVGLNTGPVVVGNVGSDLKYEYTAMGDAVNLAARMQSAARTMTLLISEHTYRYVAPVFECADLGPLEVKGKAEPVRVYEVRGSKADPGRMRGLEAAGLESPMVGRDAELNSLLSATQAVRVGRGRAVVVVGEAGLGKSRLIAEWKGAVQDSNFKFQNSKFNSEIHWAEGHCLSYGQGLPYHLLSDLLRSLIGVSAATGEGETLAALRAGIDRRRAGAVDGDPYPYLGHLLTPQAGDAALHPIRALDPQTLQTHYLSALRQFLLALAAHHPLALILDDVHWADPSSVELIARLLTLTAEAPVLFCFITRPDREAPGWKLVAAARDLGTALTEVSLSPLSEADSQQLVSNLLEVEALPDAIRAAILKKAEGNPFFVEEVIRMLIERGVILKHNGRWAATKDVGTVDIPDNVQGLLLARIDRLVDDAKRTLRVASVIGRQFSVRVLEQVLALVKTLSSLEASGLIRLATTQPEVEYLFRHALVHEAAYHSLVKQDRKQLHLAVGEAIERLSLENPAQDGADRLGSRELAPVLAQHFYQAGDDPRALKYLTLAGDAAARVYANAEAAHHYSRALEIAKRMALAPTLPRRAGEAVAADVVLRLYSSYGNSLELTARYVEALANYAEMEALARVRADRALEFAALMARAKILATPNPVYDAAQARQSLERAVTLVRELGDRASESKVLWNLMLLDIFAGGDLRQAVSYGEQSITLARELGLREQLAFTLNDIQYAYTGLVEPDHAWEVLNEARELWRELGVLPMLADNLANSSLFYFERGDFDQAIANSDEAFRISHSIGNVFGQTNSRFVIGPVYAERGQMETAIEVMNETTRLAERAGHLPGHIIGRSDLAWVYGTLGAVKRGIELAQAAVVKAEELYPLWRPQPLGTLARLYILDGNLDAGETAIQECYQGLKPESLQLFCRPWTILADGDLALAQQDFARAIALMDDLLTYLGRAKLRPFIPMAQYLKAQALLARGHADDARRVLNQARAGAQAIGSRRSLWPILGALSEIEAREGNHAQAESLRQEAWNIITYIADHCPPDLRESFLDLPRVREIGR